MQNQVHSSGNIYACRQHSVRDNISYDIYIKVINADQLSFAHSLQLGRGEDQDVGTESWTTSHGATIN